MGRKKWKSRKEHKERTNIIKREAFSFLAYWNDEKNTSTKEEQMSISVIFLTGREK